MAETLTRFERTTRTWPKPGEWRPVVIRGQRAARLGCSCAYTYIVRLEDVYPDGELTEYAVCPSCGESAQGARLGEWVPG
jgi:hypothetical protein